VISQVQTKMANVIVTFKVNLESPETNVEDVKDAVSVKIEDSGVQVGKTEIEEVAFGLKAINFICIMDEDKGSTDRLEETMNEVEGVNSVQVVDVRRAIG